MLLGNWIAGFVDGEGYFGILITKSPTRLGVAAVPAFYIGLAPVDEPILVQICETIGCGKVVTRQHSVEYRVTSLKDALTIRDFFEKYPLHTKKRETFKFWCQAIDLIQNQKHLTKDGFLELVKLRDQMNLGDKCQDRGKRAYRDWDYFNKMLAQK